MRMTLASGIATAKVDADGLGYSCFRDYRYEARIGTQRSYDAPTALTASEAGGTVSLAWTAPVISTDLVIYTVRRLAGSLPPTLPTDGTDVTPDAHPTATASDTPGAGTWSYSVFGGYDELAGAAAIQHSGPATTTGVVV